MGLMNGVYEIIQVNNEPLVDLFNEAVNWLKSEVYEDYIVIDCCDGIRIIADRHDTVETIQEKYTREYNECFDKRYGGVLKI